MAMDWRKTRLRHYPYRSYRRKVLVCLSTVSIHCLYLFISIWPRREQAWARLESSPTRSTPSTCTLATTSRVSRLCRGGEASATLLLESNQQSQSLATVERIRNETNIVQKRRRRWFARVCDSEKNALNTTPSIHKRQRQWFGNIFDHALNWGVRENNNGTTLVASTTNTNTNSSNATAAAFVETNFSLTAKASVVPTTSRGGASVKELRPQQRSWFSSPPTAAKLVEESVKRVYSVWWVNAWSEQLPTASDEEAMIRQQAADAIVTAASAKDMVRQLVDKPIQSHASPPTDTVSLNVAESSPLLVSANATGAVSNHDNTKLIVGPSAQASKKKQETENGTTGRTHRKLQSNEPANMDKGIKPANKDNKGLDQTPSNSTQQLRPGRYRRKIFQAVPLPSNIFAVAPNGAYVSSGCWSAIDQIFTLGLVTSYPAMRISATLRPLRKAAARATGLHGALSGKPSLSESKQRQLERVRKRLVAIDQAMHNLDHLSSTVSKTNPHWTLYRTKGQKKKSDYHFVLRQATEQKLREEWKRKRINDISREMHEAQQRLARLACEKDVLQHRHNPLWKYSVPDESTWARNKQSAGIKTEREFVFPPEDLVDEYLDMLFATGRLIKLNHTDLWRRDNGESVDDDDELSGPLNTLPPSKASRQQRNGNTESNAGNWFLRNGLGELIGEKAELAAYKAVCKAIMEILAKAVSGLHGVTVMDHSDIRITAEETPQLPPIVGLVPGSRNHRDYAVNAFSNAMRSGSRRHQSRRDNEFIQKAAIVESLTSQCQLAAPIMNLFPLTWQRAIISNIISLVTAVIADFCDGIEFQILGHKLSISFTPITQEEMLQRLYAHGARQHRWDTEEFEEAVRATAITLSENLKLLDRWHQRALGSGVLVMQIATLIARLVLFLVDDILRASRMDLWSAHSSGPRLLAGFEYRSSVSPTSTSVPAEKQDQEPSQTSAAC